MPKSLKKSDENETLNRMVVTVKPVNRRKKNMVPKFSNYIEGKSINIIKNKLLGKKEIKSIKRLNVG